MSSGEPSLESVIAALLAQASAAHGEYERAVLNGVYDTAWADWYAQWAVDNGLNDLLLSDISADGLSRLLSQLNEEYQTNSGGNGWAQYTARRLLESLG